MHRRSKMGEWGELQAGIFLEKHGFELLEKNYHSTVGEIDIVARKGGDFYFIEVKTRKDKELANDLAVTRFKKNRLAKTIKHYCYHRSVPETGIITAAVIILVDKTAKTIKIRFVVLS